MTAIGWRALASHALAVPVAAVIGALGFLYRFNTMGGRFGGFDNDEFATLTRVDMLLAGQQPLRDFADGELRAVWPSLTYEVPAWAQRLWGENLFVHACVTLGALALCASIVFLLARVLSRSWMVALLAGAMTIASLPNPYNYPKVLALTGAAVLLRWAIATPNAVSLGLLAAWTVVAALFRHDYGVYVMFGSIAGLIAREPRPWRVPARRVATYVVLGLVLSAPSALWVARYAGIPTYVGAVIRSSGTEGGTRRLTAWPKVDLDAPFEPDSLVAFNYYAFWAVPLVGVAVVVARMARSRGVRTDGAEVGFGCALATMALVANYFFLRSNLPARFGDAVVPVALIGAWIVGTAPALPSRAVRRLTSMAATALLALMVGAFVRANEILPQMSGAGLTESPSATAERFHRIERQLLDLPPRQWAVKEREGSLAVARYLAECTRPDDQVLQVAYADEVPYFARRRFAGGQGYFEFGFLSTEADQRRALDRLSRQSVPVAVTPFDYEREFAADYPLVAAHVATRYREVGVITGADKQPYLRVFAEVARRPSGTDPILGFPCFR